jgi:hypothetical protein
LSCAIPKTFLLALSVVSYSIEPSSYFQMLFLMTFPIQNLRQRNSLLEGHPFFSGGGILTADHVKNFFGIKLLCREVPSRIPQFHCILGIDKVHPELVLYESYWNEAFKNGMQNDSLLLIKKRQE